MSRKQIIILAVVGLVLVVVLYFQIFGQSAEQRAYQENIAKGAADQKAQQAGAAPSEPGATPAPAIPPAGAPAGARSRFESDTVNIDDLLASVKEVDFDFDKDKPARDPMAALVGTTAKKAGGTPGAAQPASPEKGPDPALVQAAKAMKVSGIMFDEKQPLAVVDNTVVGPGYTFPNTAISVDSITRTQVILKVQNKTIPLEMKEQ